ncbi:MAG: CCA tRNA nucleotidyltransferase [Chlamydiales bacterium]|nr:CCA tRNA nucleotidyltransferase [Chlamydiales bacterium]
MSTAFDKASGIVKKLRDAGHVAYFAGGWVRDYLLQKPSPDIDIATSAPPEDVIALFRHTVQVGVSFGVVMVIIDEVPFEVATFRKDGLYLYGRRPEAVEYSSPEEDAQRRDFTINGMFYDPLSKQIFDFVGGREDLERGIVRAIGDPHERFKEDRLRMIRGVRIMSRFHFALERSTRDAIASHAKALFPSVAMERVWQEFSKMAEHSGFGRALVTMQELGLLQVIFPKLTDVSLEEIVHRTRVLKEFPHPFPAILCLAQLFPDAPAGYLEEICRFLKAPNKDALLAKWYVKVKNACQSAVSEVDWIYLYADQRTELCLQAYAAALSKDERQLFVQHHRITQTAQERYIERLRNRKPVITSGHLEAEGIPPGKGMGLLLREAETISISDKIDEPNVIMERLKTSENWPRGVL